jgi:hypothetical protein
MGLNEKLRAMRDASRGKLPAETRRIMAEALQTVEASEQHLRALKPGAEAPTFSLEDHTGQPWSSSQRLEKGPIVVNFYRGSW